MFTLTGCADMRRLSTSATTLGGAVGGALIGQMIGHNTEATLIGTAIGTMLGYIVGNEMDKFDRQQLNESLERGQSGLTKAWVNPDTHSEYWVTPEPIYKKPAPPQQYRRQYRRQSQRQSYREPPQKICRKAEIIAIIDGRREKTYTTACRDNNGEWQLQ
ncbi:MAG TPA: glycine zipper 2TM domain-containing protein [Candidatus Moranbacteria bacterium]|nr:glycine zipper 2TM domain-containing protein [Candidatus Moranbacteria bacterium]